MKQDRAFPLSRAAFRLFSPLACVAALALLAPPASAEDASQCAPSPREDPNASELEPRRYVSLEWADRKGYVDTKRLYSVLETCPDASGGCPPAWEVIGRTGILKINFDRDRMKRTWGFSTRGSLAISAYHSEPDSEALPLEIEGYSQVGKAAKVVDLDLSRATALVRQLLMGADLAGRILGWQREAKIAGLAAEQQALLKLAQIERDILAVSEEQLLDIYERCLSFSLTSEHVKKAAASIAAAEAKREQATPPAVAKMEAEVAAFFMRVKLDEKALQNWAKELLAKENAPYLYVLADIVNRSEEDLKAGATGAQALIGTRSVEGMKGLVHLARVVGGLQRKLHDHYKGLEPGSKRQFKQWWQYCEAVPVVSGDRLFGFGDIRDAAELMDEGLCALGSCECSRADPAKCQDPAEALDEAELWKQAGERAGQWVSRLELLLKKITRNGNYKDVEAEAKAKFQAQLAISLRAAEELDVEARKVGWKLDRARTELALRAKVRRSLTELFNKQEQFFRAVLMVEVLQRLIDAIPDVTIDLDALGLDPGDTLAIAVSLQPHSEAKPARLASFEVSDWGWRSASWSEVDGLITFVRPDTAGGTFAPRPGAAALWHLFGKAKTRKSPLRALSPGFGISATFLDFDGQEDTLEVGLGLTVSLFRDLLQLTYGYNLQAATAEGNREFFGIGVSLSNVGKAFTPKEE